MSIIDGYELDELRDKAALADKLKAENERLRAVSTALTSKLRVIHEDEQFRTVWQIAHIHLGPYDGPTYTQELADLERALEQGAAANAKG
mgnify:CR=1 FL=1